MLKYVHGLSKSICNKLSPISSNAFTKLLNYSKSDYMNTHQAANERLDICGEILVGNYCKII